MSLVIEGNEVKFIDGNQVIKTWVLNKKLTIKLDSLVKQRPVIKAVSKIDEPISNSLGNRIASDSLGNRVASNSLGDPIVGELSKIEPPVDRNPKILYPKDSVQVRYYDKEGKYKLKSFGITKNRTKEEAEKMARAFIETIEC